MRKIFTLLFFLHVFSFSFDESYFDGQINQCLCAEKPNQCNKYCLCDPFCTDEQKKQFEFYLPETYSNSKIGCDPKNRIDKTNLNSIKKEIVNGVNCYSIEGNENGKKITNYNLEDFGFSDFSEVVESHFVYDKFIYNNSSYKFGEKIIGNSTQTSGSEKEFQYFYLPIAIGSSTSNALLPVLAGYSYPRYNSRVNTDDPLAYISSIAFIGCVFDPTGENVWLNFPLREDFNTDIRRSRNKKFFHFQYIFSFPSDIPEGYNASDEHNISIKVTSNDYGVGELLPTTFLSFSFEVFFGERANFIDNDYQDASMGYYYGVPIMVELGDPKTAEDLYMNRTSLQIVDGVDVLFGVRSTIVVDREVGDLLEQMKPRNKTLYTTFGNIWGRSQDISKLLINASYESCYNDVYIDPDSKTAVAEWYFHYTVFKDRPIMILSGFQANLRRPENNDNKIEKIIFEINFIDDNNNNEDDKENPAKFLSLNYSAIFDVFFRDESETLETTGVFLCFALIGTIWCWYSCFFYIED